MSGETLLNNRYLLTAQQGSGGMAVIYKARDQLLGRTVAIKILRPSLTADPAFITRFQNEARAIANLQHPNIVTVYDVGTHISPQGATHYIVMEFVEGPDLKKIIKTEGILNVERALHFAIQVCDGIGYAHRAGIVHADIKPQNILITNDDTVKVTDFGIAQALTDTQPQQREAVVWGSPHYFAPEQAKGEKPGAASDVYAIGIVMFEMLTGRLPYLGASQQELALAHIKERVPLVTEYNPKVDPQLAQIVAKIMSKEGNQRYSKADQLGSTLKAYRDQGKNRTMQQSRAQTPPPPPVAPETVARSPVTPPPTVPQMPVSLPTERVPIAPEAPNRPGYNQRPSPAGPLEPLVDARSLSSQAPQMPQSVQPPYQSGNTVYDPALRPPRQDSQAYRPPRQIEAPPVMDAVTIVLALLALTAVAGLIPLYIIVAQAYLG